MRAIEGALTKKEVHAILAKYAEAICKELPSDSRYAKIVLLQDLDRDLRNAQVTITYADLVPHGRWIMHDDGVFGLSCECSVCHIETCGDTPYCPHCGAKMDGGKDA